MGDYITDNERIAEWLGWPRVDGLWESPSGTMSSVLFFDTHMSYWRYPGGVFDEIKKRGLWAMFLNQVLEDIDAFVATENDGSEWIETRYVFDLLSRHPYQLVAALLKVIDGGRGQYNCDEAYKVVSSS